jgi:hypothetical protein
VLFSSSFSLRQPPEWAVFGCPGVAQVKEFGIILKRKKISPEIRVQLGDTRKRFQSYDDAWPTPTLKTL